MKRVLLVAILCLAWPAVALAEPAPPEYETFMGEALAYWHLGPPPCSPVRLEIGSVPPGDDGLTVRSECSITVAAGLRPCIAKEVVFHEVGHLLGLQHSPDPNSLMYPEVMERFCIAEGEAENASTWLVQRREEAIETREWCQEMKPSPQRRHCWRFVRRKLHQTPRT